MGLRTPAAPASPAMGDSAVDCFDCAVLFLRLAGTTAVRAAGSLAGALWVGGGDETRGELQGSSLADLCVLLLGRKWHAKCMYHVEFIVLFLQRN